MTPSALLASALGMPNHGDHPCCYCGTRCNIEYQLPDSFTAMDTLAYPASPYICTGCKFITAASQGQSPDGKPWMWSWIITKESATRHALCAMLGSERVTAGREALLQACLNPPDPPYVILLCQAGRTHSLYRSRVCRSAGQPAACMDGVNITYSPDELKTRTGLCLEVASVFGVKAARDRLPIQVSRWDQEYLDLIEKWHEVLHQPVTQIAAALFPYRKDENE